MGAPAPGRVRPPSWRHGRAPIVTGCDPGGPSPYTAAVEAAGIPIAWAHDAGARHGRRRRPDRLAVTKALTAVDPDNPELRAARAAGIPVESWQQVIADAAVGRSSWRSPARTARARRRAGWSTSLVPAGADPSAFVGALLPPAVTDGPAGDGTLGRRAARSSSRPTSTPATSMPYRPAVAILTSRRVGPPGRLRRRGGGRRTRSQAWLATGRPTARRSSPTSAIPACEAVVDRLRRSGRRGSIVRYAVVDGRARRRSAASRVGADRDRPDRSSAPMPTGRRWRSAASDPLAARDRRAARRPAATTPPTRSRSPAPARAPGSTRRPSRAGLATFTGVGRRLERKGEAAGVVGLRRLRPPSHGHPRDVAGDPPARARTARVGGLRAAHVPSDGRPARRLRRCARDRGRGGHRRHLGRPGSGHDDRLGAGLADAVVARRPGHHRSERPGRVEATADWLARRGPGRRRRPGDGRRPKLSDRRAAAGGARGGSVHDDRLRRRRRAARALRPRLGDVRWRRLGRPVHRGGRVPRGSVRAAARRAQCSAGVPAEARRVAGAGRVRRSSATGCRAPRSSPRGMQLRRRRPTASGSSSPGS